MTTQNTNRAFREYINNINQNLARRNASEQTHRPALKTLIESIQPNTTAINEARNIECGTPDFTIVKQNLTIGYIEAKDCNTNLDAIEQDSNLAQPNTNNGTQLKRYRTSLSNLILTNHHEFRWYIDGQPRSIAVLAQQNTKTNQLRTSNPDILNTQKLLETFLDNTPEPVSKPGQLAKRMAQLTHIIRDIVEQALAKDKVSNDIKDLYQASQNALVPDLTHNDFSNMFAQTLTYGLFAARVSQPQGKFTRQQAVYHIPPTNPFVKQIFSIIAGPNIDKEPFINFVEDLTSLFDNANMQAVLENFGNREPYRDPIMHFYETFLDAYDPDEKSKRGIYYTPEPVVLWIVRSVHHILQERFNCPDGLADNQTTTYQTQDEKGNTTHKQSHKVLVLDPACGTGSFLYAVIDIIRETFRSKRNSGMWDGYVSQHLLKRIFGFELVMAPYAVAHLKLGMQLAAMDIPENQRKQWAYGFGLDERLGIYLTNSLDKADHQTETMFGPMRALNEEANAAANIKNKLPIMVVIGNPPYQMQSVNPSRRNGKLTWIGELIEDYKKIDGKPLGERNPKGLQDDYVKFIRFGQWRIQQSGAGILAFITNHGYLDNLTFHGMRQQLMNTFTDIYVYDLHGSSREKERAPDGSTDQNVFDIETGVAITIFVKEPGKSDKPAKIHHADLYGTRDDKYQKLSDTDITKTTWKTIEPAAPNYFFKPWNNELEKEYYSYFSIKDVMPTNSSGITTARDSLTIQWSPEEVMWVVSDFAMIPPEDARNNYNLGPDVRDWKVELAQEDLLNSGIKDDFVEPLLYRPFDTRYTYYTGKTRGFMCMPRSEVMQHILTKRPNIALAIGRAGKAVGQDDWDIVLASKHPTDMNLFRRGGNNLFPLYLYPSDQEIAQKIYKPEDRQPNISPEFIAQIEQSTALNFITDEQGDLYNTFGPEDVLQYIYALLHSNTYRKRYHQFLRVDFPRIPASINTDLFHTLANLGHKLTKLHTMEQIPSDNTQPQANFPITGDNTVERGYPKYYAPGETPTNENAPITKGRIYINKTHKRNHKQGQYFEGVSLQAWQFHIGGNRPLHKYLADRRGLTLSYNHLQHYSRTINAIAQTIQIQQQIDKIIQESNALLNT